MDQTSKPLEIINPAKSWTPDDPNDPENVKEAMNKIREQTEEIENRGKEQPDKLNPSPENKKPPEVKQNVKVSVGIKENVVVVDFSAPVSRLEFKPNIAIDLGNMILKSARRINKKGR